MTTDETLELVLGVLKDCNLPYIIDANEVRISIHYNTIINEISIYKLRWYDSNIHLCDGFRRYDSRKLSTEEEKDDLISEIKVGIMERELTKRS